MNGCLSIYVLFVRMCVLTKLLIYVLNTNGHEEVSVIKSVLALFNLRI